MGHVCLSVRVQTEGSSPDLPLGCFCRLEGEEVESRPAAFAAGSPARGALAVLGTSPGALVRSPSRGNSGRSLGSARSFSERMREEQGKALPDDGAEVRSWLGCMDGLLFVEEIAWQRGCGSRHLLPHQSEKFC